MPVPPKPFILKCKKCNYEKVKKPKSDCLSPSDFMSICPKCNIPMEGTKKGNILSRIKLSLMSI